MLIIVYDRRCVRVRVVDDNRTILALLCALLRFRGFEVRAADRRGLPVLTVCARRDRHIELGLYGTCTVQGERCSLGVLRRGVSAAAHQRSFPMSLVHMRGIRGLLRRSSWPTSTGIQLANRPPEVV